MMMARMKAYSSYTLGLAFISLLHVLSREEVSGEALPNNGCPEGWIYYDFRCYLFKQEPKLNWQECNDYCHNQTGDAHPVYIETMEELGFLEKYTVTRAAQLNDTSRQQWWTGGFLEMDYYNTWVWGVIDEDPDDIERPEWTMFGLLREAWYPGEPNDENDEETYISLRSDSVGIGLDDKPARVKLGFICEKNPKVKI